MSRAPYSSAPASSRTRTRLLLLVAALNAVVLVLTAGDQIYDTNFYTLWEATALLAGDHPYRDFFEWGVPGQALVSVVGQLVGGHRLLPEFALQWLGIIAGTVVSLHLALRASGSRWTSLLTSVIALVLVAPAATYHYPKLLLYPLATWLMWRYLDVPGPGRAAAIGVLSAAAFLFRHDHGVYIAAVAGLAFALARVVMPATKSMRAAWVESGAAAAALLVLLAPWVVLVQTSEGLPQYVESRLVRYAQGTPYSNPYASLLTMNPVRPLLPRPRPPADPGVISFEWLGHVRDVDRRRLEAELGLRLIRGPDEKGRWYYDVSDRLDSRLLGLDGAVNNTSGLDWSQLTELSWRLPPREASVAWLEQVALLVPLLLVVRALLDLARRRRRGEPVRPDTPHIVVAAALLALVDWRLFREPGYVTTVAPLTAAMGAVLLVGGRSVVRRALAAGIVVVTAFATVMYVRDSGIFTPWQRVDELPDVFRELAASPAIDGFAPRDEVFAVDPARWSERDVDSVRVLLRYIHDCTAPGDRVLVTGQTPFQVGYYVQRPIAGGHLFWHEGFRADPVREQQSLELLQRQSVPFAYSTHDPVFDDLRRYPRIQAYFRTYYAELEGSRGLVLVDTRRPPTGTFGPFGFPCFR